ncbi:MAG: hypothetical protein ABL872_16900, partial [Lacibacter sp.]
MKKTILIPIALFITVFVMAQDKKINVSLMGGISLPKYSYKFNGVSSNRSIYQGYTGGVLFTLEGLDISFISIGLGINYLQAGAINKAPALTNAVESKNRINYIQAEAFIFKFKPVKI